MKIYLCLIIALLSISCEQNAQEVNSLKVNQANVDVQSLPIILGVDSIPLLRSVIDPALQIDLERALAANPKWNRLTNQRKIAVGLVDLSNPYQPIYARSNGNVMMYAASLPKIAILLATMDALEKGELEETPEILEKMHLMISKSSNTAATELIDELGFEKIESVLKDPKYDLYDEDCLNSEIPATAFL